MAEDRHAVLRELPQVDEVMRRPEVAAIVLPRWAVVEAVRQQVEALRRAILAGDSEETEVGSEEVEDRARELCAPSLRAVVNATGVVLHTNLGRAPLADDVIERVAALARGYTNLEYNIGAGRRGSRHDHLVELLRQVTGAEDAAVVNNNAGAVLLCLAACSAERETIVSRGELVEIGGSFRIPDVMRASGARLVEVGTTNKTRRADYEAGIGPETALLLKVHRSNFAMVGFTEEVELEALADLARERGLLSMIDLGSGALIDPEELAAVGLTGEPGVHAAVAAGVNLATFSGDKLLGGPQAGIIAGRAAAVARVRAHPLMRALRPDKMTLAALEATVALYRDGRAREAIPALRSLLATPDRLRERAEKLCAELVVAGAEWVAAAVVPCESTVGAGAVPLAVLPSFAVALTAAGKGGGAAAIDAALRSAPVPVIGRIADDQLLLDLRSIADGDFAAIARAVSGLADGESPD